MERQRVVHATGVRRDLPTPTITSQAVVIDEPPNGSREGIVEQQSQVQPQPQVQQPQPNPKILQFEKLRADLEQLVKVGRVEAEAELYGFKIKMATLTAKENTQVLEAVAGIEDLDTKYSYTRYEILARAITSVNDMPLDLLTQNETNENKVAKKVELISSWQQIFVNNLWQKYDEMLTRSQQATEVGAPELKK